MRSRLSPALANARLTAGVFLCGLLQGCALVLPQAEALRGSWPAALPARAELVDVPFFPQEEYQCGPAALATVMAHAGARVTPEDLVPQVYIPERKGTLQVEMLAAPRRRDLVSYALAPRLEDVLREVAAGNPVVVLQSYGVWPLQYWHYAVVVGFDREGQEVLLRSGTKQRLAMPLAVLEYTWKESARWAMVTVRPSVIPVTADPARYLEAIHAMGRVADRRAMITAYRTHLARWAGDVGASVGLANAHHAAGELAAAEGALREALRAHPDSVVVLNNLAQTLHDQRRHREALEVIDRAAALGGPFAASVAETRAGILRALQ